MPATEADQVEMWQIYRVTAPEGVRDAGDGLASLLRQFRARERLLRVALHRATDEFGRIVQVLSVPGSVVSLRALGESLQTMERLLSAATPRTDWSGDEHAEQDT